MIDPQALGGTSDVQARLPFDMSPEEMRECEGALGDLSDDARFYGSNLWVTPDSAPRAVKNLVVKAAARHMKNYEGFVTSRAGDETVAWSDQGEGSGSARFTTAERQALSGMARRGGITSVPTTVWNSMDPELSDESVPMGVGKGFPFYAAQDGGW